MVVVGATSVYVLARTPNVVAIPKSGVAAGTSGGVVSLNVVLVTLDHVTKFHDESITLPLKVIGQSRRALILLLGKLKPVAHPVGLAVKFIFHTLPLPSMIFA